MRILHLLSVNEIGLVLLNFVIFGHLLCFGRILPPPHILFLTHTKVEMSIISLN